ncbi:MAG: hypothetical protein JHD02_00945 [Thermoleophilaceae bacterium]|nr:hypothetical protein [Thermoleophilaceae bacterium]
MTRLLASLTAFLVFGCMMAGAASADEFGPFAPANPFAAAGGASTMHGDAAASDASPTAGPGQFAPVRYTALGAACPTVLQGADGIPIALCTTIIGRKPTVYQLDPRSGLAVASLTLEAGENLFGGVYPYIDNRDRIVVVDSDGDLLRIAHSRNFLGFGKLWIESRTPLAPALSAHCPAACGGVVGIAPDWQGRVWFATAQGISGFFDPASGEVKTLPLGPGERVSNSIATAPGRTAVVSDHALYLLDVDGDGMPRIRWRYAYDRGPSRKPGQLSYGSGATPTFFGPQDGSRFLAITDNADPAEHLLVFDSTTAVGSPPAPTCEIPVLTPGPSGTENSPIGSGRSVFVASTYGYPYPASPAGEPDPIPASAPFTGGLTRIDLTDGGGCAVRWQTSLRSAAVPRLDVKRGLIYTTTRTTPLTSSGTGYVDGYSLVGVDAADGSVSQSTPLGATYLAETLQMAPTIVPGSVLYQGSIAGIFRVGW